MEIERIISFELHKTLIDQLIVNPKIIVYGKPCIQHRSVGFFSDESIGYKYSGQFAKSIPMTPALSELLSLVNREFSAEFNGILINRYANGEENIGAHSDDEASLDRMGVIAISVGAIRKFRIRNKATKEKVIDVPTTPYSIFKKNLLIKRK